MTESILFLLILAIPAGIALIPAVLTGLVLRYFFKASITLTLVISVCTFVVLAVCLVLSNPPPDF
jgi:hypothetical protein